MGRGPRKPKIPKTKLKKLEDCEIHLFFVRQLLHECASDSDKYKLLAQELRVLVCDNKGNPLLLKLLNDYNMTFSIPAFRPSPGFPEFGIPVPMDSDFDARIKRLPEEEIGFGRSITFTDFANHGLAVYVKPHSYTYCELVRAITQQMGSGHEAEEIDEPLVHLQNVYIGRYQGHISPLISFGRTVLEIGLMFLDQMVKLHGYKLRKFKNSLL